MSGGERGGVQNRLRARDGLRRKLSTPQLSNQPIIRGGAMLFRRGVVRQRGRGLRAFAFAVING